MEHFTEGHGRPPPIDRNRELLKSAREETYKVIGDVSLSAYIWQPEPDKAPAYPGSA